MEAAIQDSVIPDKKHITINANEIFKNFDFLKIFIQKIRYTKVPTKPTSNSRDK